MDINIYIPLPIIIPPQYFKIRYRAVGAGSWTTFANQDNDPFTITGLSPGDYQLEATLVLADAAECSAVIYPFTVKDYECVDDIEAEIINDTDGLYKIHVTYTIPPGIINPPCGWEAVYYELPSGTPTTVGWQQLPTGGFKIPINGNNPHHITLRGLLCEAQYIICLDEDLPAIPPPPCDPFQNIAVEISTDDFGLWHLTINFTQSNPVTTHPQIRYQQYSNIIPGMGIGQPSVTVNPIITGVVTTLTFQLYPNLNVQTNLGGTKPMRYDGYIRDGCFVKHNFTVFYLLP